MVLSDWNGSYGYQITDDCIRNGNDLMLGFNFYASNVITDTDAASCVQALRQASKNILYTIANSGNYTNAGADNGMDNMTRTFLMADIAIAAVLIVTEALVVLLWKKKKHSVTVKAEK